MSTENVELVERMLALLQSGDARGALGCRHPEAVALRSAGPAR